MRGVGHVFITALLSCSMVFADASTPTRKVMLNYKSPMGDENWHAKGSRLRCGLALTVPDYGVAYFEQYATKPMRFLMRTFQHTKAPIRASIHAQHPVWKNQDKEVVIASLKYSPGDYGFYMKRSDTLTTLDYLYRGYEAVINYRSEQGFPVSVTLSPIRFKAAYSDYIRCLANLLPYDLQRVETTVILYLTENTALSQGMKAHLARVAEYARVDRKVRRVSVIGYTDDQGRKSYNNAISEQRAKAVGDYLLREGLPKSLLYVTWKGLKDPVASNDTQTGRAMNRRVVVRIER